MTLLSLSFFLFLVERYDREPLTTSLRVGQPRYGAFSLASFSFSSCLPAMPPRLPPYLDSRLTLRLPSVFVMPVHNAVMSTRTE